MEVIRETRLEYHDNVKNSHKYYTVMLVKGSVEGQMVVRCQWGRIRGWHGCRFSSGTAISQTKEVTENAINALVTFQKWLSEKESKGYRPAALQGAVS